MAQARRNERRVARARGRRALQWAAAIFALLALGEIVAGLLAHSLALLTDGGHMAGDAFAIGAGLLAAWLAERPANRRQTYGYLRMEILAAQANGVYLIALALWTLWEAGHRLIAAPHVDGPPMLALGLLSLAINGSVAMLLIRARGEAIGTRSALLDAGSDALGAAGAAVAGAIVAATGWYRADPAASILIALAVLLAAWRMLREVVDVLLESSPARIDVAEVEKAMTETPGVAAVHDTHIWTLTPGFVAMSGHAELDGTRDEHAVLDALTDVLTRRFAIDHVTIQPESERHAETCCDTDCEAGGRAQAGTRART